MAGIKVADPPYPLPPFFPSLINRTVSVDVKHHVYLLRASDESRLPERVVAFM